MRNKVVTARVHNCQRQHWGYTTLTVDAQNISGTVTTALATAEAPQSYTGSFRYPAAAQSLPDGAVASL